MKRLAVTLLVVLAGCGSGGGKQKSANDLVDYLPADSPFVAVVDVRLAREELKLPKDADSLEVRLKGGGTQLPNATSIAFPPLARVFTTFRADDKTLAAFDGTKLIAAATNATARPETVTAIRTTQSFDAIAEGLEAAGYKRDGDVSVNPEGGSISRVTDVGDGVVLITGEGVDAEMLADAPPGGPKGTDAVFGPDSDGAVRLAVFPPDGGCLTGFGGWQTASARTGRLRLTVSGTPDPANLRRDAIGAGLPTVVDGALQAPLTPDDRPFSRGIFDLISAARFRDAYRCP